MSCGCSSPLFGGKCCGGPGQIGLIPGVLPANIDLSGINIYNAIFYGLTATPNAAANLAALNAAAAAAAAVQGGIILIPNMGGRAGSPSIGGTVTLNPNTPGFNNVSVVGTSNAQLLIQTVNGDTFYLNNGSGAGGVNEGGQIFQTLHIKYTPGLTTGAAIHLANAPQTTLNQIVMDDPPVGVFCDNTLLCVANEVTVVYNHQPTGIGFLISGPAGPTNSTQQTLLSRCKVLWGTGNIGTVGSYAIQATQSNHLTVFDFTTAGGWVGVGITPSVSPQNNVQQTTLSNCEIGAQQYGILVQPLASAGTGSRVQDLRVFGGQTQGGSNATPTSVGVFVDPNGGSVLWMTDLKFVGHVVESWKLYGYQFNGGQNAEIIGGTISSNGTAAIACTGVGPTALNCVGVDLSAIYQGSNPAQTFALLWTATAGTATFDSCPMLGYAGPPVSVTGTPAKLNIRNCAGYNDQNTVINTVANITAGGTYSAATAGASGGTNYWGPSFLIVGGLTGGSTVSINGGPTIPLSTSSTFFFNSPYDTFRFSVVPASLYWIGK